MMCNTLFGLRYVFFFLFLFFYYRYISTLDLSGQCKLTMAKEGQHRPTANAGQQKPMQANKSQQKPTKANTGLQRPTQAHKGQHRPTKANKGQCRPTEANAGTPGPKTHIQLLVHVFCPVFTFFWLQKCVYKQLYMGFLCLIHLSSFRKFPRFWNTCTIACTCISFIFCLFLALETHVWLLIHTFLIFFL
jgi:hypothetical protein